MVAQIVVSENASYLGYFKKTYIFKGIILYKKKV
jgi:hypothetical protein